MGSTLSPDGSRLVVGVSTIHADRTRSLTSLWEVDPQGGRAPRRLTRSAKGEGGAAFLPDGSMLFVSGRPDPDGDADDPAALWLLEAGGGEARVVATRPGGLGGVQVARDSGTVVLVSATMPSAVTAEDDAARRKERKDRKVAAILHEAYPIRYWDHDLGPDEERLFVGGVPAAASIAIVPPARPRRQMQPRPTPRAAADTPDGVGARRAHGTARPHPRTRPRARRGGVRRHRRRPHRRDHVVRRRARRAAAGAWRSSTSPPASDGWSSPTTSTSTARRSSRPTGGRWRSSVQSRSTADRAAATCGSASSTSRSVTLRRWLAPTGTAGPVRRSGRPTAAR